jgi:proteasome lid subunit RPN8/RPN11
MNLELILPWTIKAELVKALKKGDTQEIGGVLMGEHVEGCRFRVVEITVQFSGGSVARFVRAIATLVAPLRSFFTRTNHEYRKFNYLGEWHSHPMFVLTPSFTDRETMQSLVEDPMVGANFAVLLLVKLDGSQKLQGSATVFVPHAAAFKACLGTE